MASSRLPSPPSASSGPRSERFPKLPPLDDIRNKLGPGCYEIEEITTLSKAIASKPSSKLGACVTTAERFPDLKEVAPGPDKYEARTLANVLAQKITSRREVLNSMEEKSMVEIAIRRAYPVPGPGTYDVNNAVGRHVANDHKFGLLKSARLKNRNEINKDQLNELRDLLNSNNLFVDKRACRRMAHLTLYFPS
ncbi:hypothetical protein HK101_002572 [Irineochytrium annulatum]|nr:hypothetical protein HK101_002572 [Irineochytrium annulatum]